MTAPPRAPTPRALLLEQDWATLRVKLKAYAWKATSKRSWERAEDLAQDAIALAFKPSIAPWDPEVEPSCFRYLTGLLRGILSNERRLKRSTHEIMPGAKDIESFADPNASSPEASAIRRQRVERLLDALHTRAAVDPMTTELARCFALGVANSVEQAQETGKPLDEVLRGRRRLYDLAESVERQRPEMEFLH